MCFGCHEEERQSPNQVFLRSSLRCVPFLRCEKLRILRILQETPVHTVTPLTRIATPALLIVALLTPAAAFAQRGRGGGGPQVTRPVGPPRFEYVGPTNAGRIAAAAAVAGKPGVYYAGAASGGVWKSSDGGATWTPTFDAQSSQAIGALAVAQTSPDIVWAGTGE